jgi:hypothetical protein
MQSDNELDSNRKIKQGYQRSHASRSKYVP